MAESASPDPAAPTIDAHPPSRPGVIGSREETYDTVVRDLADQTAALPPDPGHGSSSRTLPADSQAKVQSDSDATFVTTVPSVVEQTLIGGGVQDHGSSPNDATKGDASEDDGPALTPGSPFRPGMRLAKYTLVRLLGQGAFGAVYLGYDKQLDRDVAIKVAKTGFLVHRQDVNRFLREARSAAQLRHPQIVPVHEFGEYRGTNYIAYEYIKGQTLKNLMVNRGQLSPEEAARMTAKLARALHYAHGCNIVHRDMKPDNVLLDEHGEPHIADFGLARRDDSGDGRTLEGSLMGTPAYMSPEQASGQSANADGRSDVWSLGVMLEEMLTSVRPFEGTVTEILVAVRQLEPKSLRQINKTLPADLETIVGKCLAKKREERFSSAGELADELERWLRGEPILSRPLSYPERLLRWTRRNPQIAALLGIVAATMLIGTCVSSYFAVSASRQAYLLRQEQRERALGRLLTLQSAAPESLGQILSALEPDANLVLPRIREVLAEPEKSPTGHDRLRVALAVLDQHTPDLDQQLTQVGEHLLHAAPAEFAAQIEVLAPVSGSLVKRFWSVLENATEQPEHRLRAACALAAWRQNPDRWRAYATDVASMLTTQSSLDLPAWISSVGSVRDDLLKPLRDLYHEQSRNAPSVAAAAILSRLLADQPQQLLDLVGLASPEQLDNLLTAFQDRPEFVPEFVRQLQADKSAVERPFDQRTEVAHEQANLLLALLALNHPAEFTTEFLRLNSPDLQSDLMHTASPAGLDPRTFVALLKPEHDAAILRLACLTLAEFPPGMFTPTEQSNVAAVLQNLFHTHPSAGVHGATRWLLQSWKRPPDVASLLDRPVALGASNPQGWIEDRWAGPMTVVHGPITFAMGSRNDEPFHYPRELRHQRLIPRSFAVATLEVSVADFLRFRKDHLFNTTAAPEPGCPVNEVTWFDAIAYCRWLSEQAGVEENQMCFPALNQIGPTLKLSPDVLTKTGYRLPTAAEWEYVCRAGFDSSRSCGESETLLRHFAWFTTNSLRRSHPVGLLKPNAMGLFDNHGNVSEWCLTWYFDAHPKADETGVVVDVMDPRKGIYREIRGGSYDVKSDELRTADRDHDVPVNQSFLIGLRVARTLPLPEAATATSTENTTHPSVKSSPR